MEFLSEAEFWVAIGFVILVAAVFKPIRKSFSTGLDGRAAKIKGDIDEAARLRDEAAALLAEYRQKQSEALTAAQTIMREAAQDALHARRQAESDLATSLKRREQQALDRIAQAEAKAVDEVRASAVDLAMAITGKLLRDNLDPARAAQLVDAAIAELPQKFH